MTDPQTTLWAFTSTETEVSDGTRLEYDDLAEFCNLGLHTVYCGDCNKFTQHEPIAPEDAPQWKCTKCNTDRPDKFTAHG